MTDYRRKVARAIPRFFYIDTGGNTPVFIAGSGRSGTTWLQETINYDNQYRIMFEPFRSTRVGTLRQWNYRQYLREDDQDPLHLEPARRILAGRIRNRWIDKYNQSIYSRQRIIKDIRTQFLLGWLKRQFPDLPIVMIMRHPGAVTSSQLRLNWDTHLEELLCQDALLEDHLGPFESQLRRAADAFERHVFLWCAENYVPLRQLEHQQFHLVFYENLLTDPEREFGKIFAYLGVPEPAGGLPTIARPSMSSQDDSDRVTAGNSLRAWRRELSPGQVDRLLEILGLFGLDRLYDDSYMPLVSERDALGLVKSFECG